MATARKHAVARTAIDPAASASLSITGFSLSKCGIVPNGNPSFEDWQTLGQWLRFAEGAVHWWIGDWLNYGEQKWGEMYAQAIDATGFDYETLRHDKWVSSKVELCRRRHNLPFTHHHEVACLEPGEQEELLSRADSGGLSRKEFRKAVWEHKIAKQAAAVNGPVPDQASSLEAMVADGLKFGTIYADPPWSYYDQDTRSATDDVYPTMSLEEIAAMPVKQLAAERAHLHLWTTSTHLPYCFDVLKAWGFEYKSAFVWVKNQLGLGNYWRVGHEYLVLGVRGDLPFLDHSQPSWMQAARTKHSEKPEQVRQIIERVSPAPRLELFGRKQVSGWTVFGNQAT